MKYLLTLFLLISCTDAQVGSLQSYGESAIIYCYSGGQKIFEDVSTGKVQMLEGGGWHYKNIHGKYIRTFADCFVEVP